MEKRKNLNVPKLIQLPKILDHRGNLSFIEGASHIPFEIKRSYWIYDVPGGETRGGHAFKSQHEFIVAMSGSFDVIIHNPDGKKKKYSLNRSYQGLYVPSGYWRQMLNFSTSSIALVLASTPFMENDYIRDYDNFKKIVPSGLTPLNFDTNLRDFKDKSIDFRESTVKDCSFLELEKNHQEKGNITVVENRIDISYDINRVYYLYDVPGGEERGGHAHYELHQLLIAAGGSFDVELNDGRNIRTVTLNRPYQGLKIVPGIWRELKNFSSGSCCLVLASHGYVESDYIREFDTFISKKKL